MVVAYHAAAGPFKPARGSNGHPEPYNPNGHPEPYTARASSPSVCLLLWQCVCVWGGGGGGKGGGYKRISRPVIYSFLHGSDLCSVKFDSIMVIYFCLDLKVSLCIVP